MCVCLFVCMFDCLYVYLYVCLFAYCMYEIWKEKPFYISNNDGQQYNRSYIKSADKIGTAIRKLHQYFAWIRLQDQTTKKPAFNNNHSFKTMQEFKNKNNLTVACRGSWMPGANEVFGCPPTKKIISPYQFMSKISDDLFLVISPNFYFFFLNIFPDAPLSWMPGAVLHFLHIYPYFFRHLPMHFFRKLRRWMPPGGCPGPSHPRTPHCTPLQSKNQTLLYRYGVYSTKGIKTEKQCNSTILEKQQLIPELIPTHAIDTF